MAVLQGTAVFVCAGELETRRAARRLAVKSGQATQPFGLLVIPVDFAGERLPRDWDAVDALAARLDALRSYFSTASAGAFDLQVVSVPLVHLDGAPGDYSDFGLNGFTRTRALATQALLGAAASGLDFARADLLTANGERGWVDGVLILHAAPGVENDPVNGRVVPLQFFLDEPIRSGAAAADAYAVASLRSGLGVWAHETAHLFGLEDRYDLWLSTAGDAALSRGGLGAFSLMAAGAWGPDGDARYPALLDAYSAVQLGWQTAARPGGGPQGESVLEWGRPWRFDVDDGEYFLVEQRGVLDTPYDAVFPGSRFVIYHVDESIPDDTAGGDPAHLRVRLVEADGNTDVALGLTPGTVSDAFLAGDWSETTQPSSAGYEGPSGVGLTIDAAALPARATWTATPPALGFRMTFRDTFGFRVEENGWRPGIVSASIRIVGLEPRWGEFQPGGDVAVLSLVRGADGTWQPESPPLWLPDATPLPGAVTSFEVTLTVDGVEATPVRALWLWNETPDALSIPDVWPGAWSHSTDGDGGTTWFRRPGGEPFLPDQPLLACSVDDPAEWPDVRYGNGDDAVLVTPLLSLASPRRLRLLHHVDLHGWEHAAGADGAVVEALLSDGTVVPLEPVAGYGGRVYTETGTPLLGRAAFVGAGEQAEDGSPRWRLDVFDLNVSAGGPQRLRFRLASDGAWRGRGWLIAELGEAVDGREGGTAFEGSDYLMYWGGATPDYAVVESSSDGGASWFAVWDGAPQARDPGEYILSTDALLLSLDPPAGTLLRARFQLDIGEVVLRAAAWPTVNSAASAALGVVSPNPARESCRIDVRVEAGPAELQLHDLRGRRLRAWTLPAGDYRFAWNGRDGRDRRVPAGTYLFTLTAPGSAPLYRKVVLIR